MAQTGITPLLTRRRSQAWPASLLVLVGLLALPLGRPDREIWSFDPQMGVFDLAPGLGILQIALSVLATLLAWLPLPLYLRGLGLVGLGTVGLVGLLGWLVATATPFGLGILVALLAWTVVVAVGLSESGTLRTDPFISVSLLLAIAFVSLFILFPLAMVLRDSVWVKGSFTLNKVVETLTSPLFLFVENPYTDVSERSIVLGITVLGAVLGAVLGRWWGRGGLSPLWGGLAGAAMGWIVGAGIWGAGALPTSLYLALVVAPIATLLGLAFALLEQRSQKGWVQRSLAVMGLLPMITPPFVFAFALTYWLGRKGIITYDLLGLNSNFLFGITGVALAQILAFSPVAFLVLRGSVQGLNPALEEAAQTLRAGRWEVFRSITWPLLRPGLAAAFLLTVIESLADFGNPLLLGGDRTFLATEVYSALIGRYDPNEAAVYGTVLLLLVLGIFALQRAWVGSTSFVTVTGKPPSGRFAPLPRGLEVGLQAFLLTWTLGVVLLYGSVLYGSFVKIWGIDNTFTLQNYVDITRQGLPVLWRSAQLALASAVVAVGVGLMVAYLVARQKFWGRGLLEVSSMLSFATPGTVMGVAYILAFNTGPWLLTGTAVILVLALVFRNMPATLRGIMAGLAQIDHSLEEASTLLRASSGTTLRRILIPLLVPQLVAGAVFAFVRGMTAISQIIFLVGPGNLLATVLLLSWIEQGNLGRASAMATVLIVAMASLIGLLLTLSRRWGRAGSLGGMS